MSSLRGAADGRARGRLVERFLLAYLPEREPDARVVEAVGRFERSGGVDFIADVARHLGITRRHLVRLFRATVGLTPKVFARILRLHSATRRKRCGGSWSEVAFASGYTDQAHLTRECVQLAGVTPVELDRRATRGPLQAFFNPGGAGLSERVVYL